MKRICSIVEGFGDVDAMPQLVARTGHHFERQIISPNPIRGGEWPKIKRDGEMERLLNLAASRHWDQIMIAVDLDDLCPAEEASLAHDRIAQWRGERDTLVSVVFFQREYETIFLHSPSCLGNIDLELLPEDPSKLRDAKGPIKKLIGRRYKETSDQRRFTERLEIAPLLENCRCFQKFQKEVCR